MIWTMPPWHRDAEAQGVREPVACNVLSVSVECGCAPYYVRRRVGFVQVRRWVGPAGTNDARTEVRAQPTGDRACGVCGTGGHVRVRATAQNSSAYMQVTELRLDTHGYSPYTYNICESGVNLDGRLNDSRNTDWCTTLGCPDP